MAYPENKSEPFVYLTRVPGGEPESEEQRERRLCRQREKHEALFRKKYPQLSHHEREVLKIKGMRAWLLQGPELVREGKLIEDIFFKISSMMMGLSGCHAQRIFHAVHLRLFNDSFNNIGKGLSFFASAKKIERKKEDVIERCERRLSFNIKSVS